LPFYRFLEPLPVSPAVIQPSGLALDVDLPDCGTDFDDVVPRSLGDDLFVSLALRRHVNQQVTANLRRACETPGLAGLMLPICLLAGFHGGQMVPVGADGVLGELSFFD
jgi:hypothetical protein